jgi:UDP-2,4-diacetamido-2,4,6-trideoxy-beta-L-altropyranose hydrolase
MPTGLNVLFRTDASVAIGGGHLRRCLVLADALAEAGWEIQFVCAADALQVVPALTARNYPRLEPSEFDRAPMRCDLLIVDDYRLDASFETACRRFAARIMVIDDLADRRHDCDVLLDQSPGRQRFHYSPLVPAACELLLGPSYALLDPRFRTVRRRRKRVGPVERVFVNFGTTDAANATAVALAALDEARLEAAIDIAVGAAAPHLAELKARISVAAPQISLHLDVDNMAELMSRADVAIGACGVGAFERCALGLPSAILTIAENQRANAEAFAAAGAALYLGEIGESSATDIAAALKKLASDNAGLLAMSMAAASLVDGLGATRTRTAIDQLT